jgi:hypothetical protein
MSQEEAAFMVQQQAQEEAELAARQNAQNAQAQQKKGKKVMAKAQVQLTAKTQLFCHPQTLVRARAHRKTVRQVRSGRASSIDSGAAAAHPLHL